MADDRIPGRPGRIAAGLFALHAVLLFFPPIPPDVKGSLWSYLLGYGAVILGLVEAYRCGPTAAGRWAALEGRKRSGGMAVLAAAIFAVGVALVELAPELSRRFNREEGLWEPLTVLGYLGSAILLFRSGTGGGEATRKHLRLLGGGFLLLGLEEIDYFGVVGGILPRVDGVYVGSLHDLVNLWAQGSLPASAWAVIAGGGLLLAVALGARGYLRPRLLARTFLSSRIAWGAGGLVLVALAGGAAEAGLLPPEAAALIPEEAGELAGGVLLVTFALEVAATAPAGEATRAGGSGSSGGAAGPART